MKNIAAFTLEVCDRFVQFLNFARKIKVVVYD